MAKSELKVANILRRGKSAAMSRLNKARSAFSRAASGRPAAPVYEADLSTRIAGIPCGIVITYFSPARYNNWGHPDNRLPDDPGEVEFFVVDRKGYPAAWLERKANYADLRQWVLENAS